VTAFYKKFIATFLVSSLLFLNSTTFLYSENNIGNKNYQEIYNSEINSFVDLQLKQNLEEKNVVPVLLDNIQTVSAKIFLDILEEIEIVDILTKDLKEKSNDYMENLISITYYPSEYLNQIVDTLIRLQTVKLVEEDEKQMLLLSLTTSLISNINHSKEVVNRILKTITHLDESSNNYIDYEKRILLVSAIKYSVPTEDISDNLTKHIKEMSDFIASSHDTFEVNLDCYTNANTAENYFNTKHNVNFLGIHASMVTREPGKNLIGSDSCDENSYAHMLLSILVGAFVNQKIQYEKGKQILEFISEYLQLDEDDEYINYPMIAEYALINLEELVYTFEEYLEDETISFEQKSYISVSLEKVDMLTEVIENQIKDTASENCNLIDDVYGYGCLVLEFAVIGKMLKWVGVGSKLLFSWLLPTKWIPLVRLYNMKRISFFKKLRIGVAKYSGLTYVRGKVVPHLINNTIKKLEYNAVLKRLAKKNFIKPKTPSTIGEKLRASFIMDKNGAFAKSEVIKEILTKKDVEKIKYMNNYFMNDSATIKIGRYFVPVNNKTKLNEFVNILKNLKVQMNATEVLGFATISRGKGLTLKDSFVQNVPSTIVAFAMAQFLAKWGNPVMHYKAHKGNYGLKISLDYAKNYSIIQSEKNTKLTKVLFDFQEIEDGIEDGNLSKSEVEEMLNEIKSSYDQMEKVESIGEQ